MPLLPNGSWLKCAGKRRKGYEDTVEPIATGCTEKAKDGPNGNVYRLFRFFRLRLAGRRWLKHSSAVGEKDLST